MTLKTDNAASKAFSKFMLRVPNESDEAATIKLAVHGEHIARDRGGD